MIMYELLILNWRGGAAWWIYSDDGEMSNDPSNSGCVDYSCLNSVLRV